jgi:hypothetical protein
MPRHSALIDENGRPHPSPLAPRPRAAAAGWALLFAFLSALMLVVGIESALHFVGPAIDGPFQLYNALRRIQAGQRPGIDFQFFHGLGIPYLHYVPFRLLGGTFIASEVTRQLLSALVYPVVVLAVLRSFIKNWTRTLAWAAIVMAGSIALRMTSMLVAINSLLGIRSALPTLLPIVLCLPVRRHVRNVLAGLALGGALLLGTEQGVAAILALLLATLAVAVRTRRQSGYLADCAVAIAVGVATLVAALAVMGGLSGMRGALAYNFRSVPMDQYWYFGVPPNVFISSWHVLPRMLTAIWQIPATLAAGCAMVVFGLRRVSPESHPSEDRRQLALTVLALYGLISCASLLGTYVNAYVQPCQRVLLLLSAIYLDSWFRRRDAALGRRPRLGVSSSVVLACASTLAMMVAVVPGIFATTFVYLPHVVRDHVLGRKGAVYSGIWPTTLPAAQAFLDSRRDSAGHPPTLWSTYAGLLEARNGLFNPSFDYIIHALGPANREQYVQEFRSRRPTLVQTVSPAYTQYEAWIEDTSWDFYSELLRNYDLIGGTDWSFFWQRRATPSPLPTEVWTGAVGPGARSVQLPRIPLIANASPYLLLQVELEYRVSNPLVRLPLVGTMPRYLVRADNTVQKYPVTINPFATTVRFPLIGIRGEAPVLRWDVESLLPGASIAISRVRLSVVQTSPQNLWWLSSRIDAETHAQNQ